MHSVIIQMFFFDIYVSLSSFNLESEAPGYVSVIRTFLRDRWNLIYLNLTSGVHFATEMCGLIIPRSKELLQIFRGGNPKTFMPKSLANDVKRSPNDSK